MALPCNMQKLLTSSPKSLPIREFISVAMLRSDDHRFMLTVNPISDPLDQQLPVKGDNRRSAFGKTNGCPW